MSLSGQNLEVEAGIFGFKCWSQIHLAENQSVLGCVPCSERVGWVANYPESHDGRCKANNPE
jgi:hypothetical protein